MSFGDMDRAALFEVRKDTQDRIASMTIAKLDESRETERENLIATYEKDIRDIDAALAALKADAGTSSTSTTSELEMNRISNTISTRISEIGSFKPQGGLINVWITKIDNLHKVIVKPNLTSHPTLEQHFTSMIILALPVSAASKYSDLNDWTTLKTKLKEYYQQDISIFQYLTKMWDLNPESNNWTEIANQMQAIVNESKAHIKQKLTKDNETFTADQVFDLFGAMLVS